MKNHWKKRTFSMQSKLLLEASGAGCTHDVWSLQVLTALFPTLLVLPLRLHGHSHIEIQHMGGADESPFVLFFEAMLDSVPTCHLGESMCNWAQQVDINIYIYIRICGILGFNSTCYKNLLIACHQPFMTTRVGSTSLPARVRLNN